ncbi:hypothetical protein [Chitinophaga sancti]|uniref:Uncharacterized protein n=1 Tax=Chitinophaga sancti TaxID=1004 RepID=A0A1K1M0M9_9BACT|nr:hypothetical protein [Chitinophaga sancti]WQD64771.1 hypothetical protein U0033_10230 [Chitinophaga sancti]WQG89605.1 hypothetical protein SR876_32240 [Chitinophaga sancti]SFW15462.1 hypothetical protein SAMN05661012_00295 [Chitinophaga sancti]
MLSDSPAEIHTPGEILDIIANQHDEAKNLTMHYHHISLKKEVIDALGEDPVLNEMKIDGKEDRGLFQIRKSEWGKYYCQKDPWIIKDSLGHTNFNTTKAYLKSLSNEIYCK